MTLDVDSKRRYYNLDVRDNGSVAAKMKDSTLIEDGRLAAEVFLATIKVSKHPPLCLCIFIFLLSISGRQLRPPGGGYQAQHRGGARAEDQGRAEQAPGPLLRRAPPPQPGQLGLVDTWSRDLNTPSDWCRATTRRRTSSWTSLSPWTASS